LSHFETTWDEIVVNAGWTIISKLWCCPILGQSDQNPKKKAAEAAFLKWTEI
jgi:hypothetical protein